MNKEQVEGKLEQIKGGFEKAWGKLTDNDWMLYKGNQDDFFGVLKEKHGILREAAEKSIKEFEKTCSTCSGTNKPNKVA